MKLLAYCNIVKHSEPLPFLREESMDWEAELANESAKRRLGVVRLDPAHPHYIVLVSATGPLCRGRAFNGAQDAVEFLRMSDSLAEQEATNGLGG